MAITARYWRMVILANVSGSFKSVAELAFLDTGGADLSTGGTPFASSEFSAGTAASKSFDKDTGTAWSDAGGNSVSHIGYDHGAAVAVDKVRVSWASNPNQLPLNGVASMRVEHSDDGTAWSRALAPTLVSGEIAINTTCEFTLNALDALVTPNVDADAFARSATPTALAVNHLDDGAVPYRDLEFGGVGVIAGTVKRDADPSDLPLKRRVRLHREQDGLLIREVWSDATTGVYSFDWINETWRYTVITYDYEHNYRAVIADNILPEMMP